MSDAKPIVFFPRTSEKANGIFYENQGMLLFFFFFFFCCSFLVLNVVGVFVVVANLAFCMKLHAHARAHQQIELKGK